MATDVRIHAFIPCWLEVGCWKPSPLRARQALDLVVAGFRALGSNHDAHFP